MSTLLCIGEVAALLGISTKSTLPRGNVCDRHGGRRYGGGPCATLVGAAGTMAG